MQSFDFWRPHMRAAHVETWNTLRAIYGSGVGPMPGVEWSKRMTKTLAVAYFADPKRPDFIRLSAVQFWQMPETYVCEVVPHELAHIAAWRLFGESQHGKPWVKVMESLGFEGSNRFITAEVIRSHKETFWRDK